MKVKKMIKSDVSTFKVGDIIKVRLTDGEKALAMAVQQEEDGMIFCLVDCLAKEYPMNETCTNEGGYEASDLRKKLNGEILNLFPVELTDMMIPFDNGDLLRLPTEKEILGENYHGEYTESLEYNTKALNSAFPAFLVMHENTIKRLQKDKSYLPASVGF